MFVFITVSGEEGELVFPGERNERNGDFTTGKGVW